MKKVTLLSILVILLSCSGEKSERHLNGLGSKSKSVIGTKKKSVILNDK